MQLTAVFMQVPEGYIAFVEELPGANTQGATLRGGARESSRGRRDGAGGESRARRAIASDRTVTREPLPQPILTVSSQLIPDRGR
jgi:hypothetical protein